MFIFTGGTRKNKRFLDVQHPTNIFSQPFRRPVVLSQTYTKKLLLGAKKKKRTDGKIFSLKPLAPQPTQKHVSANEYRIIKKVNKKIYEISYQARSKLFTEASFLIGYNVFFGPVDVKS